MWNGKYMSIDYSLLKCRILESFIGNKCTKDLSLKLGYTHNQVERWLSGYKILRWSEFWDLCEHLQLPLCQSLREVFAIEPSYIEEPSDVLRALRGYHPEDVNLQKLAEKLGCHVSALKRYMRGDTSCSIEFVFCLMDVPGGLLERFVCHLTHRQDLFEPRKGLPTEKSTLHHRVLDHPLMGAVQSSFNLESYKNLDSHQNELIAERVGASVEEVRACVDILDQFVGHNSKAIKFEPKKEIIQLEGLDRKGVLSLFRYWSYRAYIRLSHKDHQAINLGPHPNFSMVRIVALSAGAIKKLLDIQSRHYREICAVVDHDMDPKEEVRVILMHNFGAHESTSEILPHPKL